MIELITSRDQAGFELEVDPELTISQFKLIAFGRPPILAILAVYSDPVLLIS